MPNPVPRPRLATLLGQPVSSAPASSIVWLTVTLVADTGTAEYDRFRKRLQAFLAGSGLMPAVAFDRIALIAHKAGEPPGQETLGDHPVRATVDPADKALVVHWLMNQPEVVLIAVTRPRTTRVAQVASSVSRQHKGSEGHGQGSN